jgi:H+/Cl- antiporter ClcA
MPIATVATGVAAGVSGAAITLLLHLVQHLAFGYTENTFLIGVERASPLRRILATSIGGALAGTGWWLHRRRIRAADVSVTHALRDVEPRLPVGHTTLDAVLQVLAVGVGGSLGREGAPRQVGAAVSAWLGERVGVTVAQRRVLLACGAGAGLAAVYNVPFGGAAFTLETLLASAALADVTPAVVTALIATVVAWPVLSNVPTYTVPHGHLHTPLLVWSVLLGPVAGVCGVLFVRLMNAARRHAVTGWRIPIAVTIVFGVLGAAAAAYPELLGNGKGQAQVALAGTIALSLSAALVVLKPLATAACLRAGAIGGLLTPALATGAALGACTGRLWTMLWPGATVAEYAVVAAAALLAVTQRAPVTGIVLTLEFVGGDLALVVPMVLAVSLGTATAWYLDRRMTPLALVGRMGVFSRAHVHLRTS